MLKELVKMASELDRLGLNLDLTRKPIQLMK